MSDQNLPALTRLIGILSPPIAPDIGPAKATARLAALAPVASPRATAGLAELLARRNGAYGFENALFLLPLGGATDPELAAWNRDRSWRAAYDGMADDLLVFAFDGFGGGFAIDSTGVVSFDPETGERISLASDIEGWAAAVLDDYPMLTGHSLVREWQARNGALQHGERLEAVRPFVLGGPFEPDNLARRPLHDLWLGRAALARAIRDLPDGATISWPLATPEPPAKA